MPGRCGFCLAADTHRLLSLWIVRLLSLANRKASEDVVVAGGGVVVLHVGLREGVEAHDPTRTEIDTMLAEIGATDAEAQAAQPSAER